ncbi:MAG: response regulator [Chloroflexota bacterium]
MAQPQILVIDDNRRTVKALEYVLKKNGFEVLTAFNGPAGLRIAREQKPNLIILDIMMPVMDGYEVCRRLKQDPETEHIAVLMLTGRGRLDGSDVTSHLLHLRTQEQMEGYAAGALEFLSKPIGPKELIKHIKALLWTDGLAG